MATVTRENIGTLHEKINIKLTREDYLPSFEKSLKQYARNVNVPGFRKGNVPAGMVKKMYGQSIFSDEVLRSAGSKLEEYLKNENVSIFAQPMVMPSETPLKMDMNNPEDVDFSFEIGLKPDFSIDALKNAAPVLKYKVEVTDKMVADEIDRIQKRYGTAETQEAVTTKDDIIYCKYEQSDAEGNVLPESQMVEDTVLLEKLPAKLQEMLMGKKNEESFVIRPADVCTPEELPSFLKDPLKQGADAANNYYKFTLTRVAKLIPRELNAELYAQVVPNKDVKDEAEFKELIRTELSKEFDRIAGERIDNEIYEMLVHTTPFQLPVNFLKRWMKEGGDKPKSDSEVEKEFPGFDHQLRWTLISDKLIQDNGINVDIEEVKNHIKAQVLGYFGMSSDDDAPWMDSYMQKMMKDNKTIDETYRRLLFEKLFAYLREHVKIEEKEVSEEEFYKAPSAHHHHH